MLKPYVSRSTKTTGPLLVELVMMFMMVPLSGAAILYQQPEPMWDTWVYQEGEDYHLFFMSKGQIGRAISQDLIHWKHLPVIPNMAKPGDWDAKGMKTGCTVKHDDTYYMSYGSGPRSPIGFLVSKDLINWKRYGDNPVLTSQPPYRAGDHWRDLSSYYDAKEQQWHGFLFGIHEKSSRPSIAHLTSEDYLHWQYHEPVFISEPYSRDNNGFVFLEVPDYFQMGEKHYILFSSVRSRKSDTSGRKDASGTWYLISTRREGPYQVPSRPLLLGSGRGRHDHYVGRTLTYKGKRLLYHHTWGDGPVNWGTLKEVHQNQDGSLCLKYWSDLDLLATETLMKTDRFTLEAVRDTRKLRMFNIDASDIMVTCTLDLSKANAAALIWRSRSKTREGKECATGLLVDSQTDTVSIVSVEHRQKFNANTILTHLKDDYQQEGISQGVIKVRIMVRAHIAEVYLNDTWLFCTEVADLPTHGDVGVMVDSGQVVVTDLEVKKLEPIGEKKTPATESIE